MFEIVKVICVMVTALIIVNAIREDCSRPLAFALFAIWLRFALSAFHDITHQPLFLGLSINALGSVFVVALGILYLPARGFLLRKLIPLYLFLLVIVVSGLYNLEIIGLLNVIVKWAYFFVLSLAILLAARIHSLHPTLVALLKAFYLPVALLFLSILLGESKATERDGSISYIGGYRHESGFSMVIISFALIVSLINKKFLRFRTLWFYIAIILLYMVNYRTALITILPIVFVFIFAGAQQKIRKKYQLVSFAFISIFVALGFYIVAGNMSERFADISIFLGSWNDLLKAPAYFSQSEKAIFSSRVYIWSQYMEEVYNASRMHQIVGHGPESWKGIFDLYAHNTYISYIFEYGYAGLVAFTGFIIGIFVNAFQIKHTATKAKLMGSLLGFLIMNMATMPLWSIEGLIILSVIFGVVLGCSDNDYLTANERMKLSK